MVDNTDEFEGNADVRRQLQQLPANIPRCALCQHHDGQVIPTIKGEHTVKVVQVGTGHVCTDCAGLAAVTSVDDVIQVVSSAPAEMLDGAALAEMIIK
jgi:hypothetical protein